MSARLEELKARLLEVNDLGSAAAVLRWDQATYMPPGGAVARGRQLSTLSKIAHEKFTSPVIGRMSILRPLFSITALTSKKFLALPTISTRKKGDHTYLGSKPD